jgi:hypothetical protein
MFRVALVVAALGLFAASAVLGADAPAAPKMTTVVGVVAVTKDDAGAVTAVKVIAKDAVYEVTLDAKGTELGNLVGKEVAATGVVSEKDGVKWITVESYKEVEKPAPAKPAK